MAGSLIGRVLVCQLLAISLLFGPSVSAQTPPNQPNKRIPFPNGRHTPREMVETFSFAWEAMKGQIPGSLVTALSCIDFPPETTIAEKGQIAIFLGEILDYLSPPFLSVTATEKDGKAILYKAPGYLLQLEKGKDQTWRFDRETVAQLPTTYQKVIEQNRGFQSDRTKFLEGLGDPTDLFETFMASALSGNWETAAQCLDLREIPAESRRTEGPRLAALLAASIQRLGFVYYQDVPNEPIRPPYAWWSGPEGAIILARITMENAPDRWNFNANTVKRIHSIWSLVKHKPVDPRWEILKKVVPNPDHDSNANVQPENIPPEYSSPKKMMEAFLRSIDQAEHDDTFLEKCISFLDLRNFPKEEASRIGPKYVEKLEIIIRKLKPSIHEMDDRWTAPTTVISDKNLKVRLIRRTDGRWGFSEDTVNRIPTMFESLPPQDKGIGELNSGRSSPRETFINFLRSVNDGRLSEAAKCLDLSDLPLSARSQMGPLLAIKLKAVIDRVGWVYFHEIPSEAQGPRYLWHRGPIGRISLARLADQPDEGWRFTDSTVAGIDQAIEKMINMPVDKNLEGKSFIQTLPSWWMAPGLRIRFLLPESLRAMQGPLQVWQWIGLVILPLFLTFLFFLFGNILDPITCNLLGFHTPECRSEIHGCLRSIRFFLVMCIGFFLLPCLDLPMGAGAVIYTLDDFLITAVIIWSGFGCVDLVRLWCEKHKDKNQIQGFQDLVLPFLSRIAKLVLVLGAMIFIVSCFDDGTLLGRFLAGLGVVGLAVSLAAQDSLKNLFATMLLIGDRSFSVGDLVHLGSHEGTVVSVGFRSTRLKTKEDSILIIPNAHLASSTIDNLGVRTYRRVPGHILLESSTHPDLVTKLKDELKSWMENREELDKNRNEVSIHGIGEKGVELRFTGYAKGKSAGANKFREDITLELLSLCEKLGIHLVGK